MKTATFTAVVGALAVSCTASPSTSKRATSVTPVTVKGNGASEIYLLPQQPQINVCVAFFAGNQRFYIRGVDYQPGQSLGLLPNTE